MAIHTDVTINFKEPRLVSMWTKLDYRVRLAVMLVAFVFREYNCYVVLTSIFRSRDEQIALNKLNKKPGGRVSVHELYRAADISVQNNGVAVPAKAIERAGYLVNTLFPYGKNSILTFLYEPAAPGGPHIHIQVNGVTKQFMPKEAPISW